VQGVLVRDTFVFAGITVAHQSFLLTEFERMWVPDHAWDGIMGLAMPRLAMDGPPIFTKLLDAGVNPIFTFVPDRTASSQAQLHIGEGGYSNFAAPGTLQWLDASSDTFWTVEAYVGVSHPMVRKLLIDTGTSLLLMPPHDMAAIVHGLVPPPLGDRCMIDMRLAMVFCACADITRMRPLHLYLGNRRFSLEPEDLFEPAHVTLGGNFPDEPACGLLVSVTPRERGAAWIVGDVFLRKVVTIFDFVHRRVGFAQLTEEPLHAWGAWSTSLVGNFNMSPPARTQFIIGTSLAIAFAVVSCSVAMSVHRTRRHLKHALLQHSDEVAALEDPNSSRSGSGSSLPL